MIDIIALVLSVISIIINIYIYFFSLNKISNFKVILGNIVNQINRINKNNYNVLSKNIKDISAIQDKIFQ